MDKFGVPCPQCGSVQVTVGEKAERPPAAGSVGEDARMHVPRMRRCSCSNCRYTFHHDFAFGD